VRGNGSGTRAVVELLRDDARQQELKARALARAQIFDWDLCTGRTLEILERVGNAGR